MTLTVQSPFYIKTLKCLNTASMLLLENEASIDPSLFHLWHTFQIPHNSPCHLLNILCSKEWGKVLNRTVLCLLTQAEFMGPTLHSLCTERALKCVLTVVMETGSKKSSIPSLQVVSCFNLHWHLNHFDSQFFSVCFFNGNNCPCNAALLRN